MVNGFSVDLDKLSDFVDRLAAFNGSSEGVAAEVDLSPAMDDRRGTDALLDLLSCSGVNHANAERAATTPPEAPLAAPALALGYAIGSFSGAYGGDTDAPFGWGLISRWLEGHLWPNGDTDKLRKLSTAWDDAAKACVAQVNLPDRHGHRSRIYRRLI